MDQRTVLVTGASSGIGRATATALAEAGALVLAHARDHVRATTLAAELEGTGGRVIPVSGDLGSLHGVRALARQVHEVASQGVHVVINNAGAAFSQRRVSADGIERTLAVNHLAVAALISTLLGALRDGADASGRGSRVVNLSSTLEKRGNRDLTDWSYPDRFSQVQAYSDSKLINLAYTYALARALSEHGVTVNAADPGNVATAFGRNAGGILRGVQLAGRPFMAGPVKGARTSVRLASDPSLDGVSGVYFRNGKPAQSSAASRDPAFGDQVYRRTAALLQQPAVSDLGVAARTSFAPLNRLDERTTMATYNPLAAYEASARASELDRVNRHPPLRHIPEPRPRPLPRPGRRRWSRLMRKIPRRLVRVAVIEDDA